MLDYVDWRIVAECLRDDDDAPPPLRATIVSATSDAGVLLNQLLMAASGELESACLARELYTAADLAALTGATAARLQEIVAGLTLQRLFGRRMPISGRPEDIPAVRSAAEALDRIGKGERIFGLVDQADAGDGMTPITTADTIRSRERYTVTEASRYFGSRGQRGAY